MNGRRAMSDPSAVSRWMAAYAGTNRLIAQFGQHRNAVIPRFHRRASFPPSEALSGNGAAPARSWFRLCRVMLLTGAPAKVKRSAGSAARGRAQVGDADTDQPERASIGLSIDQGRDALEDQRGPLGRMRQAPAARQDAEIGGLELEDDAAPRHTLAGELGRDPIRKAPARPRAACRPRRYPAGRWSRRRCFSRADRV